MRVRINRQATLELLLRRNMTQRELAQRARLGPSHLSHLLAGRRSPSPGVRRRLLEALAPAEFSDLFEIMEGADGR